MDHGEEICTTNKGITETEKGSMTAEMTEVIPIHIGISNRILRQTFVKEDLHLTVVDLHLEITVEVLQEDGLVNGVLEEDGVGRQWAEVVAINGVDLVGEVLLNGEMGEKDQETMIIVVDMDVGDWMLDEYTQMNAMCCTSYRYVN